MVFVCVVFIINTYTIYIFTQYMRTWNAVFSQGTIRGLYIELLNFVNLFICANAYIMNLPFMFLAGALHIIIIKVLINLYYRHDKNDMRLCLSQTYDIRLSKPRHSIYITIVKHGGPARVRPAQYVSSSNIYANTFVNFHINFRI